MNASPHSHECGPVEASYTAYLSLLPPLGLRVHESDILRKSGIQRGAAAVLCLDAKGDFMVVVMHRGQAPTETLLHLLHDMSLVRQALAGTKDVRGMVLAETANQNLSGIIREVPNVSLHRYRLALEIVA